MLSKENEQLKRTIDEITKTSSQKIESIENDRKKSWKEMQEKITALQNELMIERTEKIKLDYNCSLLEMKLGSQFHSMNQIESMNQLNKL